MIKNKLKISLMALVIFSLVFMGANSANAAALTYTSDVTVDLSSPDIDLTILGTSFNSEATSVVVGTGTLTVTVPSGSIFKVTSASRSLMPDVASTSNFIISQSCNSSLVETTTIAAVSESGTVVLTPGASTCIYSSGGGGDGGSSSPAPVVPATPATPATGGNVIGGCGNRTTGFSTTTGVSCVGNTSTTPATPATPASPSMCKAPTSYNLGLTTLKNGSRGEAVKELQRFLNRALNLGLVVDGMLGPKTIAVMKKWQTENSLVSDGLIGKLTKAKINAWASCQTVL